MAMQMTQALWNATHRDFKTVINGTKFRMWEGCLQPVVIVKQYEFAAGAKVRCNGYPGAVVRHYAEGMFEVRVPGGVVCVGGSELLPIE